MSKKLATAQIEQLTKASILGMQDLAKRKGRLEKKLSDICEITPDQITTEWVEISYLKGIVPTKAMAFNATFEDPDLSKLLIGYGGSGISVIEQLPNGTYPTLVTPAFTHLIKGVRSHTAAEEKAKTVLPEDKRTMLFLV
jgi:hypothetical protein